ncbi:C-GCAxxG-C-C family (seleno)protein [Chloroflexota bacterium]
MSVVDASFDQPLKPEERASKALAGGFMNHGYQCGMIWGAALAAGAQVYRRHGPGSQAETETVVEAQRLVESFRARNKHIDCSDITDVVWKPSSKRQLAMDVFKFLIKGGPIGCFRIAAKYAPEAFSEINTVLSEEHIEAPSPPVSCAAMLAQKMGETEKHTVMTAGFAGGIGLSGSACGALGAAIWIIGLNCLEEGVGDNIWNSEVFQSRSTDTIDRFLKSTDYEFECSEIVGRRFENIGDHAGYLREGGCSEVIEALASQ